MSKSKKKKDLQSVDLHATRHTCEHVLTQAMMSLYGGEEAIIMAMGPPTEDGFYFDFDIAEGCEVKITPQNFPKIEKRMKKIIQQNLPIRREEVSFERARELFVGNPYKLEWLDIFEERGEETVSVYWTGDKFVDLCKGPHVESTGQIGPLKLLSLAGAYWHGDENNKMLNRIYGTCFATQEEIDKHLWQIEEAKRRDHRKLGKELDLFTFSDLVGPGLPLFTPKGTLLRNLITDFLESIQAPLGYQPVDIPHITKPELYKISGHWDKFKDDIFHVHGKNDAEFAMKPMNCPHHTQIYASRMRSYRDLPLRFSEVTKVYRDESTGELQGLSRVRSITQDDAHVFCSPDQVIEEGLIVNQIIDEFYAGFGLSPSWVSLSTWDPEQSEKYLGTAEEWAFAEQQLKGVLEATNTEYRRSVGEAAFYGPKIDYMFEDSLGREWQLATNQFDYFMPTRFGLKFTNAEGQEETPVMIHRAICGSIERFLSVIIEHYAGAFPVWLSPVQAMLIPIADRHIEYCEKVAADMRSAGLRAEVDTRSERMNQKIREAQLQKIPTMLVVGDKEIEAESVAVRLRSEEDKGVVKVSEVIDTLSKLSDEKSMEGWG